MIASFSKVLDKLGWEYHQLDTPDCSYRFTPNELKRAKERFDKVNSEELFSPELDILFECPCGQSMMVNSAAKGKEVNCTKCSQKVIVP